MVLEYEMKPPIPFPTDSLSQKGWYSQPDCTALNIDQIQKELKALPENLEAAWEAFFIPSVHVSDDKNHA